MKKVPFVLMLSAGFVTIAPTPFAAELAQQDPTFRRSTWTVQDTRPASAKIQTGYVSYATLTNSQDNSLLKKIKIEVSLHHTVIAKALGISIVNQTTKTEDYGIDNGPSRIAINFILENDDLISEMSSFLHKAFGEEERIFGYRWSESYIADDGQKYSCISVPLDNFKWFEPKIFYGLVTFGNLTNSDEDCINRVIRVITNSIEGLGSAKYS